MRISSILSLCMLAFTGLQGQTGPGGVGSTASNILWIQGDSCLTGSGAVAAGGQLAATLVDQSGNGNDILQSYSTRRGTISSNYQNGHAAVSFDGTNDFYFNNFGVANFTQLETFTVMNFDLATQPAGNTDYFYRIGASKTQSIGFTRANTNSGALVDHYLSYTEGSARWGPTLTNSVSIHAQSFTSTTPFHFLRTNGQVQVVDAHNSTISIGSKLNLGRYVNHTGHPFDGKLLEMIMFTSNLNVTQRVILENHLASKYALTLAANDKFAHDVGHGNDVTGIGQESATDNHTDARGASIVQISAADDLENAEYMLWGHDAGGLATETGLGVVPNSWVAAGGHKLVQEWRADISGGDNTIGSMTIVFDLTGNMFGIDPADFRVLIDTDGDFSNASVDAALPAVAGAVITFTSVTLSDGDFFTIGNSNDIDDCFTLTGGDWDAVATIWSCGSNPGPDSTNNITISDGHSITLLGAQVASANDLTLEADGGSGGGFLILDDGATLIVKGNLVLENGTGITFEDDAVLILRGVNGNQAFTNNSGSTLTMTNLQLNNTDGATMSGTDGFELSNGLSLTNGNLTNNSTFTFLSDVTATATLSKVSNGALIDGTGTNVVQRFRGARNANWGDIGSSGVDTDLEDLNGEVFMSGLIGGNGYTWNSQGGYFHSVYTWNPTTDVYVQVGNTSAAMTPGVGFEIWLADNNTTWGAQSWELSGAINTSTTTITVNSSTGNSWNLIANPWNGFLDWDAITAGGQILNNEYWYLDADLNTFSNVTAGAGATVPPGQGFWVQTLGTTTLSWNPSTALASGVNTSTFLKRKPNSEETMIHVRNNDQPFGAAVYLRKDEMSFDGFDQRDISPLRLPDPRSCRLSIEVGAEQLMVNYVPAQSEVMEIPMTFEPGLDGDYTFSFDGLDYFSEYSCVSIRNEESGEVQQSLDNSSIITIDSVRSDDAIEYTLIFSKGEFEDCQIASNTEQTEGNINVWNTSDRIIIDYVLDQTVMSNVFVQNSLGQTVWSGSSVASYNRQEISTEALPTGLYVVSVHINGNVQSKKLIIQ